MNDFDRFLELKLRQMLDPVVAGQPPSRRGRLSRRQKPLLAVVKAAVELPAEPISAVGPVVVAIPIAAGRRL